MNEEKKENNENIVYCILKNNLNIISIRKLPFIIGRKENCDLFINNPSISKKHAIIQFDEQENEEDNININKGKEIILIDNSLNGSYVNGTKITNGKKILLETGDKISFGNDKTIYLFELMNYDNDRTIVYPSLLGFNKIETNPISLVNEDYYQKSEINHFNTQLKTKNSESNENNNSNTREKIINKNNKKNKNKEKDKDKDYSSEKDNDNDKDNINEIKKSKNEEQNMKNKSYSDTNNKIEEKKEYSNVNTENKHIYYHDYNNSYNIEKMLDLKQEIFDLKKENELLKVEINNLKDLLEKKNNENIKNVKKFSDENKNNNYNNNEFSYKIINTETSNSMNSNNINLLADDLRELGLFRRIKETLVPNYEELNFEELSNKFDNIIIEYKKKYNIADILLNMENEFNNEIAKFNNIISLQQEQKRDTLNKINYLFNKENNLEENNNYSKANKYLIEQLNQLISDKETNIKIINHLKGNIIKLKTEINLYKTNNEKNTQIKLNNKLNNKFKYIENIENSNDMISPYVSNVDQFKNNYIDYNIDKYSIGYDYNKNNKNKNYKVNNSMNTINNNNYIITDNNEDYYYNSRKNDINLNENQNENNLLDDYQRLNILIKNSKDNKKYQEIIKQKELIVNGIK